MDFFTNDSHPKYIRVCEGSIRVKLERGDVRAIEHFNIRHYKSFNHAMKEAIKWRDTKHMELFGCDVPSKIVHITPRNNRKPQINPETGEILPDLMAGISYGIYNQVLRYVIVSQQVRGKPEKTRFKISELGLDEAIRLATELRVEQIKA